MHVIIVMTETKPCDDNIPKLKQLFGDPRYFTVTVYDATDMTERDYTINCLNMMKNETFLLIKDSSICYSTNITQDIDDILAYNKDMYFLSVYNDDCTKYSSLDNKNITVTTHPTSTQAVIYTPNANQAMRSMLDNSTMSVSDILNQQISSGILSAVAYYPNIIYYDASLAVNNTDYNRLNQCVPIAATSNTTTNTIVWLSIIAAIILLVSTLVMIRRK